MRSLVAMSGARAWALGPTLQLPLRPSTRFGVFLMLPSHTTHQAKHAHTHTRTPTPSKPSTATAYTRARAGRPETTTPSRRSHKRVSSAPLACMALCTVGSDQSAVAVRELQPIGPGQWSIFAAERRDTRCISLTAHAVHTCHVPRRARSPEALDDSCHASLLLPVAHLEDTQLLVGFKCDEPSPGGSGRTVFQSRIVRKTPAVLAPPVRPPSGGSGFGEPQACPGRGPLQEMRSRGSGSQDAVAIAGRESPRSNRRAVFIRHLEPTVSGPQTTQPTVPRGTERAWISRENPQFHIL